MRVTSCFLSLAGLCLPGLLLSSPAVGAELERRPDAYAEDHAGIRIEYGSLARPDGVRLRTILTRPEGVERPPVILFVQWLSCDTVEIRPESTGGWARMMRGMVRDSGWAMMRTDKRGVGDSGGGPCDELDYDTELADHRAALAALRARDDVDTDRIVVFGASMGARMASQVAAGSPGVVGVLTWGGGSKTWFERMVAFDRNALERGGADAARITAQMRRQTAFQEQYLLEGRDPPAIIAADPSQAEVWSAIKGTSPDKHYGRAFAFHHQAQQADWVAAWGRVEVPVLVTMGEFDWFENRAGHETVARIVNRREPGLARLEVIPAMDHHFTLFDSAEAAFAGEGGRPDADPFLGLALPWLAERRVSGASAALN